MPTSQPIALAIASLGLAVSLGVGAQTSPATTPTGSTSTMHDGSTKLASSDRKFIEEAAMGGMAEVELGKLAQQQAGSDAVKQFGARMVQDHGKANDELQQVASAKGLTPPATLDKQHMKDKAKLAAKSGVDFDRAYVRHMQTDHKKDIAAFTKEAQSGKDAEIKAFAAKTLPTLQQHMQMLQSLAGDAVGAATTR